MRHRHSPEAMHPLDESILEAFRRDPSRSFTTTEMVREVFPKEYSQLNKDINTEDRKTIRKGYALKARLHRKLLYHINKLVEQELLLVTGVRGKGEKLFQLAMDEGELVVQSTKRKIVIAKPSTISTQIDGYEKEELIRKYEPGTWLNKHNAIMLDCIAFENAAELQQRLQKVFTAVNDGIALNRLEHVLEGEGASEFLHNLMLDARDYDVAVSLIFNFPTIKEREQILQLLKQILPGLPQQITIVFNVNPRQLTKHEAFFSQLLGMFSEYKQKLMFKNSAIFNAPIFSGKAGPYAFTEEDWSYYKKHVRGQADGCVIGQLTLAIDINRYFKEGGSLTGFRELTARAAHAFFDVDEQRRRHFGDYFGFLATSNPDATKEFFKVGRNYLRFWNYDWAESEQPILELLSSVKEEVGKFCTMQETIFKSCGLPIRFKIGLSTSFAKFDQDFFSDRRYQKTAITTTKELQTQEMKQYLEIRERLFKVFDGADRLRFFIARGVPVEETMRIARYLLNAYALPSFTLDFRGKTGELKLTTFMEGN